MSISRRKFLGWSAAAVATGGCAAVGGNPIGGGAPPIGPQPTSPPDSTTPPATDPPTTTQPPTGGSQRRLVVLQLGGGNDAFNTLVPAASAYRDARPTLAVPEADLVTLNGLDGYSLHPGLASLAPLWDAGQLALVAGIGWAPGSRSHFEQLARWWQASDTPSGDPGWIGRWLDTQTGDDPLTVVGLRGGAPAIIGGTRRPTVMQRPSTFKLVAPGKNNIEPLRVALGTLGDGEELLVAGARDANAMALAALERVNSIDIDPASDDRQLGDITRALGDAADLMLGDEAITVAYVNAGGFDTHFDQTRRHNELTADIGAGIAAFQQQIAAAGQADDVLLIVWSEFGRRLAENGSGGTDHGKGGVAMLVGPGVAGGLHGALDLSALDDGDAPVTSDARTLHAAALSWLGADADALIGFSDTGGLVKP